MVSFIVAAVIPQGAGKSFLTGFLGLFLLWGGLSFWISNSNAHILAHKVSLLILKMDNPYLLMLVTSLIGAMVAGFAAMTAGFLRGRRVD